MLLKTILNHRYPLKGFVYVKCQIVGNRSNGKDEIHVQLKPRKNSRPRCGSCGKPGSIYDTRKERRFQFVPILGLQVFFLYAIRRVNCVDCGVKTERLGWFSGKERMNWSEVAKVFGTSWNRVYRSVRHAVMWGIVHREEPPIYGHWR